MLRPVPEKLNEQQLTQFLSILIEKTIEKLQQNRPELKNITPRQKKELAESVSKLMMQNGEFSRKDVIDNDPKFLHKLTIALVLTANLGKHEGLFDSIKNVFSKKGTTKEEDLLLKLSPTEIKKMTDQLQKQVKQDHENAFKNLKESKLIPPKPTPNGKKLEEFDPNIYLLGLTDPYNTGGIQAVVTRFVGEFFGVPRVNPYYQESNAQIAQAVKTNDTVFGDSQGLNETANQNLESLGSVVAESLDQFRFELSHEVHLTPK